MLSCNEKFHDLHCNVTKPNYYRNISNLFLTEHSFWHKYTEKMWFGTDIYHCEKISLDQQQILTVFNLLFSHFLFTKKGKKWMSILLPAEWSLLGYLMLKSINTYIYENVFVKIIKKQNTKKPLSISVHLTLPDIF